MRSRFLPIVVGLVLLAGVPAQAAPRRDANELQARLNDVQLAIRAQTSLWLALVGRVRHDQAVLRHTAKTGHAPGARRAERELERLMPGWLEVKRNLHAGYRRVKALLRRGAAGTRHDPDRVDFVRPPLGPSPLFQACPLGGPFMVVDSFGAPRPGHREHEGIDLMAPRGTPILAVLPGTVTRAENTLGGRALILRTHAGYSYYAHLARYGASGDVGAGDVIGFVGTTGDAKGLIPHLHFEWHPGGGDAVDPFALVQALCP